MKLRNEDLKKTVTEVLERARSHPGRDGGQCERPDEFAAYRLRCDIALLRRDRPGVHTVIMCNLGEDLRTLARDLGRALLCRTVFEADHAIICVPSPVAVPSHFVDACARARVRVLGDAEIVETLAEMGCIHPDPQTIDDAIEREGFFARFNAWLRQRSL